jgi:hypothetical protein
VGNPGPIFKPSGHLLKRFLTISTSRENKKPIDRSFREKNYKQMYEASNYPVEPHIKKPKALASEA